MDILNDDGQRDNEGMDLLKQGYAKIDADQGIVTPEEHAKRVHEMNKQKVESGESDSVTKLTYAYGKLNEERVNGLNPHQARRKAIADNNMEKLRAELKRHREAFPEAFND